jgi:hypothetical protein
MVYAVVSSGRCGEEKKMAVCIYNGGRWMRCGTYSLKR